MNEPIPESPEELATSDGSKPQPHSPEATGTDSHVQADTSVIEMHNVTAASLKDPCIVMVAQVNWKVLPGEYWVIGAPQHSGKTDFLMMTGGLTAPRVGEYIFLGEAMPIFEEPGLAHRIKLGIVFDGGQLLSGMSVADNVALPLRYHRELSPFDLAARVTDLLKLMDLAPMADCTPGQIGRAWQQRAGLARALALQPQVLLLDSPLTGLDVRHSNWWLGFLDQLSRGHPWVDGRPMTLVVTADDFRPWRGRAKNFAYLAEKRFTVLGDWAAVERSSEIPVRELLDAETAP